MQKKYQAPIVTKAFSILNIIAKNKRGMGISEISNLLGISKSTVHGITAALEQAGAVIRDPVSKQYNIGLTLMDLGKAAYERIDFKAIARPALEKLRDECEETVFFGIKNGDRVSIIDKVDSQKDLKITSPVGTSLPLQIGAIGKIFLSLMNQKELENYLQKNPLISYTADTIIDIDLYKQELEKVRKNGFALDDEEYITGVRAVASAIKPYDTYLPAIWVVGFKNAMPDSELENIISLICTATEHINHKFINHNGEIR
jgi:IclR family transcriptional regulator, KDG regulon repressor